MSDYDEYDEEEGSVELGAEEWAGVNDDEGGSFQSGCGQKVVGLYGEEEEGSEAPSKYPARVAKRQAESWSARAGFRIHVDEETDEL